MTGLLLSMILSHVHWYLQYFLLTSIFVLFCCVTWFKNVKAYINLALIFWTVGGKKLLYFFSFCTAGIVLNFIMCSLTLNYTLENACIHDYL